MYVFINNTLALNLGGIHGEVDGTIDADTLGLTVGKSYSFDLFYADRDTPGSTMKFETDALMNPQTPYVYNVQAVSPDGDAITYSLANNANGSAPPTGMTIDPNTGVLSWSPNVLNGNYNITIQASDGHGGVTDQSYALTVNNLYPQPGQGPEIQTNPARPPASMPAT